MKLYEAKKESCPENTATMDESSLIKELREYLQGERYFIVFDDVWDIGFWEDVEHALLENNKCSRILITTRNEGVADFCKRYSLLVHVQWLQPLTQEDVWELFCKKTFRPDFQGQCPQHLEELSMDIVAKCGGLPLAIVAIGGLLASKEKVVSEWKKLLDNLSSILASDPHLQNVSKILSLSYGDLPYNLKSCFLYFGMFPEDFSVNRGRLVQLWMANGFVQAKQGMTLKEVAEEYLTELIHRSLIQVDAVSYKGTPSTLRVHDLVYEVILSKSEELSFCHVSSECSTFEGITRHVSISNRRNGNWKSGTKSQTRSIIVLNGIKLQKSIIDGTPGKCKLLTALDFEGCPINHIPKELGNLVHLKYLNLRRTKVSKLPKSIGKLHKLEFIDLRSSYVEELPVEINMFPKTQHLFCDPADPADNVKFFKIRGSIKHLELIQTIYAIRVDDGDQGVSLITELGVLKQLRKLGIWVSKREHGRDLCPVLEKMTQLRSLWFGVIKYKEDEILEVQSLSSPPTQLQTLSLVGKLGRLPDWISKLHNLAKLQLCYSGLMDDPIKVLQALPNLKLLCLLFGYDGEKMQFEGGGFQKLKGLVLTGLNELKSMTIDEGAMPLLEQLGIGPCPQLKKVPSGIQNLKHLEDLSFVGMSNEFNERISGSNEGEDYWMVKHVPTLHYDGTYDPDDQKSYAAVTKPFL